MMMLGQMRAGQGSTANPHEFGFGVQKRGMPAFRGLPIVGTFYARGQGVAPGSMTPPIFERAAEQATRGAANIATFMSTVPASRDPARAVAYNPRRRTRRAGPGAARPALSGRRRRPADPAAAPWLARAVEAGDLDGIRRWCALFAGQGVPCDGAREVLLAKAVERNHNPALLTRSSAPAASRRDGPCGLGPWPKAVISMHSCSCPTSAATGSAQRRNGRGLVLKRSNRPCRRVIPASPCSIALGAASRSIRRGGQMVRRAAEQGTGPPSSLAVMLARRRRRTERRRSARLPQGGAAEHARGADAAGDCSPLAGNRADPAQRGYGTKRRPRRRSRARLITTPRDVTA